MVINMKILITGATSGIAYETALKLLEQNNFVYLCTHTEEEKYLLKEKLANKSNAKVYKLDVCNENDLKLLDILDYDVFIAGECPSWSAAQYSPSCLRSGCRRRSRTHYRPCRS